jgi:UDP-N-acetylglucosamine--N-acetylmuramyl-(pentapeptide) pyrophosphoryl-undecaprenol N-acetylglucosamine transferase
VRVIIAGGGTGGHLFPGVALAEELLRRGVPRADIAFAGTARGIEARAVPREGFALELIDVGGLKGGGLLGVLRGLLRLPRAFLQSLAILRRRRPELVVGVGGYASGPMVATAWLLRVPTAILEQNSVPGITNRLLGRVVGRVFASYPESLSRFPAGRATLVGNPIRARLAQALLAAAHNEDAALQQAVSATQQPDDASQQVAASAAGCVLVLGGSQGARAVNQRVAGMVERWAAEGALAPGGPLSGLHLLHQSGAADADEVRSRYARLSPAARLEVAPFIEDMGAAYAAADLIIARAGATTLAEITALGRAAVLIPLPTAADDHQTVNARSLSSRGAAVLLPQAEATPERLSQLVRELLADPARRQKMAAAARALGRPAAAAAIVDQLLGERRPG